MLSSKKVVTGYSTSKRQRPPPTTLCLTDECMTFSKSSEVQPESTLKSDLFQKTLKTDQVDTFIPTESIQLRKSQLVCTADDPDVLRN